MPQGGFYLYADISKFGLSSGRVLSTLIERFPYSVTPGTDFGIHEASRYIRFSCTTSEANIEEGLSRLAKAIPFLLKDKFVSRTIGELIFYRLVCSTDDI